MKPVKINTYTGNIFVGLLLFTVCTISCNFFNKKQQETVAKTDTAYLNKQAGDSNIVATDTDNVSNLPEVADASIILDSINFKKFSVAIDSPVHKALLQLDSNTRLFRTRIRDAYKSNVIDFAGHYIGVVFGCGAGCISGFIIDTRDGKIYNAPLGEENMCMLDIDKMICRPDSRLFISAICRENEQTNKVYYNAFVWNEEKKEFEAIDSNEFLIKTTKQ